MHQPPGFVTPSASTHVCKLDKALYGLKQSPRAWYHCLYEFLLSHGFFNSHSDSSLFIRHTASSTTIILVYVDDIIITGSSSLDITAIIHTICTTFDSCQLEDLSFFLGIEATRKGNTLRLCQTSYAFDLLTQFHLTDCKPASTPTTSNTRLSVSDGDLLCEPTLFLSMVGGLQYLMLTRPDIAFAVNQVCQFMHHPRTSHFQAAKRFFVFLKAQFNRALLSIHLLVSPSRLTLILIGRVTLMIVILQRVHVFIWVPISYPGQPRNNPLFLDLAAKLNTVP